MTDTTISLTEAGLFTALRSVILGVIPTTPFEVVKGQVNRVAPPLADYAVMIPLTRARMGTNRITYTNVNIPGQGRRSMDQPTQFTVQVDIYGPHASDNAQIIATVFRDSYSCVKFRESGINATPLYADDPRQMVFTDDETQYEDRWSVDIQLQANIAVGVSQEFADTVVVSPVVVADTVGVTE